jgi:RNA polymerase sigma factor (sigma-70 family)
MADDAPTVALDDNEWRKLFDEVVRTNRRALAHHCSDVLQDRADIDDAIQNAVLDVWTLRHKLQHANALKAWLFRRARWAALSLRRSLARTGAAVDAVDVVDENANTERAVATRFDVRRLLPAINALPKQQRHAILLFAVGHDRHEAAVLMNCVNPSSTLHYARANLERALALRPPGPRGRCCASCGKPLADRQLGPTCSHRCGQRHRARQGPRQARPCPVCKNLFVPVKDYVKTCSRACGTAWRKHNTQ